MNGQNHTHQNRNQRYESARQGHTPRPVVAPLFTASHESMDARKTITLSAVANHRGDVVEVLEQPKSHGGHAKPHRIMIPADLLPDVIESLYAALNAFNAANGKPEVQR